MARAGEVLQIERMSDPQHRHRPQGRGSGYPAFTVRSLFVPVALTERCRDDSMRGESMKVRQLSWSPVGGRARRATPDPHPPGRLRADARVRATRRRLRRSLARRHQGRHRDDPRRPARRDAADLGAVPPVGRPVRQRRVHARRHASPLAGRPRLGGDPPCDRGATAIAGEHRARCGVGTTGRPRGSTEPRSARRGDTMQPSSTTSGTPPRSIGPVTATTRTRC